MRLDVLSDPPNRPAQTIWKELIIGGLTGAGAGAVVDLFDRGPSGEELANEDTSAGRCRADAYGLGDCGHEASVTDGAPPDSER